MYRVISGNIRNNVHFSFLKFSILDSEKIVEAIKFYNNVFL